MRGRWKYSPEFPARPWKDSGIVARSLLLGFHGSEIFTMLFVHSSASDAAQMSKSASITSPIGACWLTRNNPGQERPLIRNSGKRHGIVLAIMCDQDSILAPQRAQELGIGNSLALHRSQTGNPLLARDADSP